jgi:GT2 family glycosyltransferase
MGRKISKVLIVVVHFDNVNLLNECLESCQKITYPNHEIILVNNGGRSNLTLAGTQSLNERVTRIINLPKNLGYASANNHGIKTALTLNADYVLLLNDDTTISSDFLEILVQIMENSADVGMLGPAIYYFDEPKKVWFAGARFDPHTCKVLPTRLDQIGRRENLLPIESDYITGCALMIKKAVIEAIGLLDERFFLYWEDVDWGLRAQKAGFRNLIVPKAYIWHKISISTGGPDSPLKAYHKTRSNLFLAKIHNPDAVNRLQRGFFRDIAWLLFKSGDKDRINKARAYVAAIKDYYLGRTDEGPCWLWRN